MEPKKNLMTREGLEALEAELKDLKENKRYEIAQKIKEAREQGDLSENAEYDAAKDEQRDIEARIEELENILKHAEVIEEEHGSDVVSIGATVKIFDVDLDEEQEFRLVGSTEADSMNGRISNESPLGSALIGHRAGETVKVETEYGIFDYKILNIQR